MKLPLPCPEGIQGVFPVPPKLVLFRAEVAIGTSLGTMTQLALSLLGAVTRVTDEAMD